MNSYSNDQVGEHYDGYYATQASAPDIDPQQYEINRIYRTPGTGPDAGQSYTGQQQGYMPPFGQQSMGGFDALKTENTFPAGLCYLGFWVTGLLFLIFGNRQRLVRFHAMQSLLFFGAYTVLMIFLINLISMHLFLIGGFAIFALVMLNVVTWVGWFVGIISAFKGKYTKLPIVGDIAEQFVNGNIHLK